MTLVEIYPAIALTSAAFAFYALGFYRFHKAEKEGNDSLAYSLYALCLPAVGFLAFWYLGKEGRVESIPQMMLATVVGLTFGVLVVFAVVQTVKWLKKRTSDGRQ